MNINLNYNNYIPNYSLRHFGVQKRNSVSEGDTFSFQGKQDKNKNIVQKFYPYALAGLIGCGTLTGCSDNRVSGLDEFEGTKIEYVNVEKETKDSIAKPLFILKSKLTPETDFLSGVEVDVVRKYKDMDDGNSFRTFLKGLYDSEEDKGVSFYSDNNLTRRIVIQEGAHGTTDKMLTYSVTGNYSAVPAMRHSLMHEVGHQFDEYFGHNHDADFAQKWDSVCYAKEQDPTQTPYSFSLSKEDKEIKADYIWNSGLSDDIEFQDAFLKDLSLISKMKKTNPDKLACNIGYYTQGIDFDKPVTSQDVDLADDARSEVYANLFSYAIGEDDGDKADFVSNFSNSYRVVKSDIARYLKINL